MLGTKLFISRSIKIYLGPFFDRTHSFRFYRKKCYQESFYKNQKSNFPSKICEIGKNVKEQNCLFRKYLQFCYQLFFHRSYIFFY